MQETAFVDSQGGLLSSRGGAQTHWHRHIGTSLTNVWAGFHPTGAIDWIKCLSGWTEISLLKTDTQLCSLLAAC